MMNLKGSMSMNNVGEILVNFPNLSVILTGKIVDSVHVKCKEGKGIKKSLIGKLITNIIPRA